MNISFTKEEFNFTDKKVKKGIYFFTINQDEEIILNLEATKLDYVWAVTKVTYDINHINKNGPEAYEINISPTKIDELLKRCDETYQHEEFFVAVSRTEAAFIDEIWNSLIDYYIYERIWADKLFDCNEYVTVTDVSVRFSDLPKDAIILTEEDIDILCSELDVLSGDTIIITEEDVKRFDKAYYKEYLSPAAIRLFEKAQTIDNFVRCVPVYKAEEEEF